VLEVVGLFELLDFRFHYKITAPFYKKNEVATKKIRCNMIERLLAGQKEMKVDRKANREQLLAKIKADRDAELEEKKKGWMSIPNPCEKTLNMAKGK
jgi:hypothetical protein